MDKKTLELLQQYDDSEYFDNPVDFDWELLSKRVANLLIPLQEILGLEIHLDDTTQDASYSVVLSVPSLEQHKTFPYKHIVVGFGISFSNFGNFFTIYNKEKIISDKEIRIIVNYISSQDFIYISSKDLDVEYVGRWASFGIRTWGNRYFDFI